MKNRFSLFWSFALIFLCALNAWGYSNDDCIECHKKESGKSSQTLSIDEYLSSVHGGELQCMDCHKAIQDDSHTKKPLSGSVNCLDCHDQGSTHGQENNFPCYHCHTRHTIYSASDGRSSVNGNNLKETCGECHPQECREKAFLAFLPSLRISSHPKQNLAGQFDDGMCIGCHQGKAAHGEATPVNKQSCYKCHLPIGKKKMVLGYIHTRSEWDKQPVTMISGYIFLIALGLLLFFSGMFLLKKK